MSLALRRCACAALVAVALLALATCVALLAQLADVPYEECEVPLLFESFRAARVAATLVLEDHACARLELVSASCDAARAQCSSLVVSTRSALCRDGFGVQEVVRLVDLCVTANGDVEARRAFVDSSPNASLFSLKKRFFFAQAQAATAQGCCEGEHRSRVVSFREGVSLVSRSRDDAQLIVEVAQLEVRLREEICEVLAHTATVRLVRSQEAVLDACCARLALSRTLSASTPPFGVQILPSWSFLKALVETRVLLWLSLSLSLECVCVCVCVRWRVVLHLSSHFV